MRLLGCLSPTYQPQFPEGPFWKSLCPICSLPHMLAAQQFATGVVGCTQNCSHSVSLTCQSALHFPVSSSRLGYSSHEEHLLPSSRESKSRTLSFCLHPVASLKSTLLLTPHSERQHLELSRQATDLALNDAPDEKTTRTVLNIEWALIK